MGLSIAIKEMIYNKKMTAIMIICIIIVTMLITSVNILTSSYQDYIINLSRSRENWEANFSNVEFKNINYIENDENIKEISIVKDLGITEESYSKDLTERMHIKAYDVNALKNLEINLKEGELPQNTDEIIINEDMTFEIGDQIEATIGKDNYTFTIVGKLEKTDFDEFDYIHFVKTNGAIILFDRENISENEKVDVSILTNDISNIYVTTEKISQLINADVTIKYNDELLSYACVAKEGSEFEKTLTIVKRNAYFYYNDSFSSSNIYNI